MAVSSTKRSFDWTTAAYAGASIAFVLLVLLLLLFGQRLFGLDQDGVLDFLAQVQASPWSFAAVVVLFSSLALVGFPQTLLYAGTVAVFGGVQGALYGWAATIVSSLVTYHLGLFFGGFWVTKISAGRARTLIGIMQQRGLLASMVVRWTPTAPMVVVNAICGASGMALWKFLVGTSLGIIPKIALIAFFTQQIDDFVRFITKGDTHSLMAIGALVLLWVGFIFFCRRLYQRLKSTSLAGLTAEAGISPPLPSDGERGNRDLNDKSKAECESAS